jgi:hypothetical protein
VTDPDGYRLEFEAPLTYRRRPSILGSSIKLASLHAARLCRRSEDERSAAFKQSVRARVALFSNFHAYSRVAFHVPPAGSVVPLMLSPSTVPRRVNEPPCNSIFMDTFAP